MSRTSHLLPLLLVMSACATVGNDGQHPPLEGEEARQAFELHSRESASWCAFDRQLNALHATRITMRSLYDLPAAPPVGESDTAEKAWAFCLAARRGQLASMRAQEAMNDLEHCRQALEIAEQQLTLANAGRAQAQDVMEGALGQLREEIQTGDRQAKLGLLGDLAEALPGYYDNLLCSLSESL